MKKGIVILILAVIIILATSCNGKDTNADEYGNIKVYTIEDLPEDGVFVKSDDIFFPAMPVSKGMSGEEFPYDGTTMNPERFFWFVNKDYLIPVYDISKGHELIMRADAFDLSNPIKLEKFEDRGFTIGVGFEESATSGIYKFMSDRICDDSVAAEILKSASDMSKLSVVGINDQKMAFNMFDASSTLINLQKNGIYELNIYQGTTYAAVDVVADAHIFFSGGYILIEKFNLTRNGYALIQLPEGFPEGIYDVEGYGLVKIISS